MRKFFTIIGFTLFVCIQVKAQGGGANDASFNVYDNGVNVGGGTNGVIKAMVVLPDDKILIGGNFSMYNGVPKAGVVRLLADGSIDNSFNPGGAGLSSVSGIIAVTQLIRQPDGKILVGLYGSGNSLCKYNGIDVPNLFRLNQDGSLDNSFNNQVASISTGNSTLLVLKMLLQPDGKILIVAPFFQGTFKNILRINNDGSKDNSFETEIVESTLVLAIGLLDDGNIFLSGTYRVSFGVGPIFTPEGKICLNEDGTYNSTLTNQFNYGGVKFISRIPDGKYYIAGSRLTFNNKRGILRLLSNAGIDPTFNFRNGQSYNATSVNVIETLPNGGVLIAGKLSDDSVGVFKLHPDGSLDESFHGIAFGSATDPELFDISVHQTNKLLVSGDFNSYNGVERNNIARLLLNNDEACGAYVLTPGAPGVTTCTNPIPGDVSIATNSGLVTNINSSGHIFYNNDLWYKFVATQSTCLVRVDQDGDFRSAVNLYSSNECSNVGPLIQNDKSVTALHIARYNGLITGNTYYIQVSRRDTANLSTTYSICLLTPALNNEICGAIDLPNTQPLSVNCSNEQSGDWNFGTASSTGCVNTYSDFWYKFTATHTTHVIKTSNVADMAIYQAASCNGPLNLLTCRGTGFTINQQRTVPLNNLVIGNTYYIAIGKSPSGINNDFTICQMAVENAEPCGAVTLSNCTIIPVDVAYGTNTLTATCQSVTPRDTIIFGTTVYVYDQVRLNDLWYTFTAMEPYAELLLSGPAFTGLFKLYPTIRLATFGDCNNLNSINIIQDCQRLINPAAQMTIPFSGLTIGQTYYIAISNGNRDFSETLRTDFNMELRQGLSSVIVTADLSGPVCNGTPVTFTAIPTNGGSSPQLNWFVNNVLSGSGTTFSSATLQNNDVVTCALTSSNCVAPPTVNQSITMDIYPVPTWYQDADGDGFGGVTAVSTTTCVQPTGFVLSNTDCDDADPTVYPGSENPRRYRTRQNGNWGSSLTWESFDGCNWIPGGIPSAADREISINHHVTIPGGTTVSADFISVNSGGTGMLTINGKLNLTDWPGSSPGSLMQVYANAGLVINEGGSISGTGTVLSYGQTEVNAAGVIAVNFINNHNFYFTRGTQGCCPGGLINLTDGITNGKIDNDGTFYVFAYGSISQMEISNGEFYNRPGGTIHMEYKTVFNVTKFTNLGEFFLGGSAAAQYTCTVNSAEGSTNRGRIRSGDNNKKFVMQTGGTLTYAADCIIDANIHFSTGTHEIFNTSFGSYDTRISTTVLFGGAEINFPGLLFVEAGIFGGPAVKKIANVLYWWAGTVSGGNLVIHNGATAELGAGQAALGILATSFVNNGTVNVFTAYGGCCIEPVLNMTNGTIENNSQFIFSPTGGGGIRNVTFSGGTFNNNASGTLINNATVQSSYGDNEIYLRNAVFANNGTILANGKSLNIFPTTDPVINGTITVAAGAQVKFGAPNTSTTISSNAVISGPGTVYFFEGNHQVNSTSYHVGNTTIGQSFTSANVFFNAPNVALNFVFMYSGILGGSATKLLKDDMVFISGQITGGPISNTDTSVFHYGAGNPGLGAMNTAFTNNGVVEVNAYYGGCCSEPVINLSGGSITNNGTFNVTGSGGIRYVGLSGGSFINNAGAVINSHVGAVSFGESSFRMQPASFVNLGTINVLGNIMELGAFTVGGIINTSPNTLLRSTGAVIFNGSMINNNGNITAPINYNNSSVKTIKGTGTFSSSMTLTSAATVTPGGNPGILNIAGNYNQGNGELSIEIEGTTPGSGHDRLAITGTATLSGTLSATEINGFNPQTFTSIDILTASSVTGTFSQVNLPQDWTIQYNSNRVTLRKFYLETYYADTDGDGYGDPAVIQTAFNQPPGYVLNNLDCDDTRSTIYPGAPEICDGLDNNCDGVVDTIYMPGLIMYMPLNGNANDLSLNGLHGTINGSVTATTDRFGNAGGAMFFPGNINSHIRINDQPLVRPSSITLSAWVKMNSQPGHGSFITKSINCYNDSWHFGSQGGNYSTWVSNTTNCGDFVQMTSPNSVGNWRHVVFTLDDVADTRKMYVDGNLVATGAYTSTIPYDGNPVLIGAAIENGNLDFPFHGSLDDVMIFNRAITATEVNTLFTQGSPVQPLTSVYYEDADGDGFGNPAVSQVACSQPTGYVLNNMDCDDTRSAVYPGALEICDGLDNNCDGQIDVELLTTGLVAYYPFNGNANDLIGSLNGTVNGATLTADRFGNPGNAYSFDGINDFIRTSNVATTQTDNWTLSAWVKPAAISPDVIVVQNGGDGGGAPCNGYSLGLNNLNVTGYHPCVAFLSGGSTVQQTNQWIHLAMVRQSGVTRFYLNGVQTPNTFTSVPITPAGVITIGSASGIRFFNGSIDDVKIYNIALTPAQVLQDINATPVQAVFYQDSDGDGFGNPAVTVTGSCGSSAPSGYVADNTDCNDANVNIYPGVSAGAVSGTANLCVGATTVYTSSGQTSGTWSSGNADVATVDPVTGLVTAIGAGSTSVTYTIPSCDGPLSASQSITVVAIPVVNAIGDLSVGHGSVTGDINFTGTANGYQWTNSNPSIGLAAGGSGNIPSFTATNPTLSPVLATITVTPVNTVNGTVCTGNPVSFTITVAPTATFTMHEVPNQVVCAQTLTSTITFNSNTPGVTYSWTNSEPSISLAASGTGNIPAFLVQNTGNVATIALITVTPSISDGNGGTIDGIPVSFTIKVNPMPTMNALNNVYLCHESISDPIDFSGQATFFTWTNNNEFIGLPNSGSGISIQSFIANNLSLTNPAVANINVIPFTNDGVLCQGSSSRSFSITVNPKPFMNNVSNRNVCHENILTVNFSGFGLNRFEWVDNADIIGLPQSGIGNIASQVFNFSSAPYSSTITVTPQFVNVITCSGEPKNFIVTVNPIPELDAVANQRLCVGQATTDINFTSNVGDASFTWTNSETNIGLPASGTGNIHSFITTGSGNSTIVARASANGCLGGIRNISMIVDPVPQIDPINDTVVCNNSAINPIFRPSLYTWTNSNTDIGLPASGQSPILGFIAQNTTSAPISATITLTPYNDFCTGQPVHFTITVNPTASVNPIPNQQFCDGSTVPAISFSGSSPDIVYSWTNSDPTIGLAASGTGNIPSFTPPFITNLTDVQASITVNGQLIQNGITCPVNGRIFGININALPSYINALPDKVYCNGTQSSIEFTLSNSIPTVLVWTNSNPSIGIAASGTGNINNFSVTNNTTTPQIATITLTPRRFLPDLSYCDGASRTFTITVLPIPSIEPISNKEVCPGATIDEIVFSGHIPGTVYEWTNDNPSIGLPASGTGNIASFVATNQGYFNQLALIQVRPKFILDGSDTYCTGQSFIFTILVKGNTQPPVVTANGPTSFCPGQSVNLVSNMSGLWNFTNSFATSVTVFSSGDYYVTNQGNGCGEAISNIITVTVLAHITPTVSISASANPVCSSTPVTFTANHSNLPGVLTYEWFLNNTTTTTNSNTFTVSNPVSGDIVQCRLSTNLNCSSSALSNAIQLAIQPPANAGTIQGLSTLATGFNYPFTTNGNQGGVWSSSNTSVITIDPVTGISTTISAGVANIVYTLLSGCNTPRSTTRQIQVVNETNAIIGADYVCPQSTTISYSLSPTLPSGGTWSISNPSLASFVVQQGTDRVILLTPLTTGIVTITYTMPGNNVVSKIVEIMQVPVLSTITGPRNLCEFYGTTETFVYAKEATNYISGYQWTIPSGLTLISGQGSSSITVSLSGSYVQGQSYQLKATPVGFGCPASVETISLLSAPPQTPASIIASSGDICSIIGTNVPVTYRIPKVTGASSYIWQGQAGTTITHPNGLGKNDTIIHVTFSQAFATSAITVASVNGCGVSNTRSITVTRANPASPSTIAGPTNVCEYIAPGGNVATYTVPVQPGVTSYQWTVPAGAINLTGQGTNVISFKYPAGFSTGSVSVVAINQCGTSSPRSLAVRLLNPGTPGIIDVINVVNCPNREYTYTLSSMPSNATSVQWTAPGQIISGQGTSSIRVLYPSTSVIGNVTATAVSNCGTSGTRTVAVKLPACFLSLTTNGENQQAKGLAIDVKPELATRVELFPNPSSHEFNIRLSGKENNKPAKVRVLDLQGRLMQQFSLMPETVMKFGRRLPPGSYLVVIEYDGSRQVQKLIKQ